MFIDAKWGAAINEGYNLFLAGISLFEHLSKQGQINSHRSEESWNGDFKGERRQRVWL